MPYIQQSRYVTSAETVKTKVNDINVNELTEIPIKKLLLKLKTNLKHRIIDSSNPESEKSINKIQLIIAAKLIRADDRYCAVLSPKIILRDK